MSSTAGQPATNNPSKDGQIPSFDLSSSTLGLNSEHTSIPAPPPPPENRKLLIGCDCGNVEVYGNVGEEPGRPGGLAEKVVWLEDGAVYRKHPELSYLRPPHSTSTLERVSSHSNSRSRSPVAAKREQDNVESTMMCLVCQKDVYRVDKKGRDGEKGSWVELLLSSEPSTSKTIEPSPMLHLLLKHPSDPSTYALSPSSSAPSTPISYLPQSPEPFFLPPPFTPSHPYFNTLARSTASSLRAFREKKDAEIKEYMERQKKELEIFEDGLRKEVESVWNAFERGMKLRSPDNINTDDGGHSRRESVAGGGAGGGLGTPDRRTSFGEASTYAASTSKGSPGQHGARSISSISSPTGSTISFLPPTGNINSSLLSASLHANSYFPQSLSAAGTALALSTTGTHFTTSFQKYENPVTAPIHLGKSGQDLDVASSLRVSHMESFGSVGKQHQHSHHGGGGSRRERGRRGSKDFDPTHDPAHDPSRVDFSPTRLDRGIVEEETDDDEEQAAKDLFEENMTIQAGRAARSPREEERTPRARTVKLLSGSAGTLSPPPVKLGLGKSPVPTTTSPGKQPGSPATPSKNGNGNAKASGSINQPPTPVGEEGAKRKVKFEEPVKEREKMREELRRSEEEEEEDGVLIEPEDAVFDFEEHDIDLEEAEQQSTSLPAELPSSVPSTNSASPAQVKILERNKELVENKLSDLVAADAPSHRGAWRNNKDKLWQVMGRTSGKQSPSPSADDDDEPYQASEFTGMAASMPIRIVMPSRQSSTQPALELKTSLREKPGMFVPPLKSATRRAAGKGQDEQDEVEYSTELERSTSRTTARKPQDIVDASGSPVAHRRSVSKGRSPSVTRATRDASGQVGTAGYSLRDRHASFPADPGPALDAVIDSDEDEEIDEEDIVGGKSFVPPHAQGPSTEEGAPEAGWMSLAS